MILFYLTEYVTPYRPPADEQILRFQRIRHLGEEHPLDAKAVMTVKLDALCRVAQLDEKQRHKFILLCASHYNQATGELRFSCERFPTYNQNKRYLSDILDRVLDEVKVSMEMSNILYLPN
jgi:small subunit ribosomal protein S35